MTLYELMHLSPEDMQNVDERIALAQKELERLKEIKQYVDFKKKEAHRSFVNRFIRAAAQHLFLEVNTDIICKFVPVLVKAYQNKPETLIVVSLFFNKKVLKSVRFTEPKIDSRQSKKVLKDTLFNPTKKFSSIPMNAIPDIYNKVKRIQQIVTDNYDNSSAYSPKNELLKKWIVDIG